MLRVSFVYADAVSACEEEEVMALYSAPRSAAGIYAAAARRRQREMPPAQAARADVRQMSSCSPRAASDAVPARHRVLHR